MFPGKLPSCPDRMLGAARIAVPGGAERFCAKIWNGAHPPDMPTTALPGEMPPEPGHHQGAELAPAIATTIVTTIAIQASREILNRRWDATGMNIEATGRPPKPANVLSGTSFRPQNSLGGPLNR
jgi:hypothetical protein